MEGRLLARIRELEGSVAELEELRDIASKLGIDVDGATGGARSANTASAAPARLRHPVAPGEPRRAPRVADAGAISSESRVTRRERVLELVAANPGVGVRELVEHLGVNRTSLYPVVRQLISDGLLVKDGKGLTVTSR